MDDLNLLRRIAWSFHATTQIEYDELFGEACLAYCEYLKDYVPEKGKFSTFIYTVVKNTLRSFVQQHQRYAHTFIKDHDFTDPVDESGRDFEDFLTALPEEAREMAIVFIESVDELPEDLPPKMTRGAFVRLLRSRGWTQHEAWGAVRILKEALN